MKTPIVKWFTMQNVSLSLSLSRMHATIDLRCNWGIVYPYYVHVAKKFEQSNQAMKHDVT